VEAASGEEDSSDVLDGGHIGDVTLSPFIDDLLHLLALLVVLIAACSSDFCKNDPQGNYVVVNAEAPFSTMVKYPGVPSSITLKSQAVMQLQQQ